MMRTLNVAFVLALLIVAGCQQPTPPPGGYDMSQPQAEAVQALLDEESGRRVLTASDNQSPRLADQQEREPGYEPYFAEGDFDGNDTEDFIVAVQEGEAYDLYLFRASEDGYRPASWFVGMEWLPEAGLFVEEADRRSGDMIGVGSFFSDDMIWFAWDEDAQELTMLHSEAEESEAGDIEAGEAEMEEPATE